jgi:hypothetical protein
MKIAEHAVLSRSEHCSHLPTAVSTLYALAQLSASAVQRALTEGLIHPEMEQRDAVLLLRSPKATRTPRGRVRGAQSDEAIQREIADTLGKWRQRYPQHRDFILAEVEALAGRGPADDVEDDEEGR